MADDSKKKVAVVAVCTLLLIAMAAALLTIGHKEDTKPADAATNGNVSASKKAITSLCSNTDYKQTCIDTLESSGTNATDPKQLIQTAFSAAIKEINKAMERSAVLDGVEKDSRGKAALQNCRELAGRATTDLQRSFDKMKQLDLAHLDTFLSDMQIWLSGAITYQETCLDGFEGVAGDSGSKMRGFLTMSMEMTSNVLAMVTGLSSFVTSIITGQSAVNSRRLLLDFNASNNVDADRVPTWVGSGSRRLLQVAEYDPKNMKADVVVAKDGSGDCKTIMEALLRVPKKNNETFTVYIKEGVYEEKVQINSSMKYLVMVGDGPTKTKITGHLNFIDGTNTYQTATVGKSDEIHNCSLMDDACSLHLS